MRDPVPRASVTDGGVHRRRTSGFSLIELMIAVAIVGVLAALAVPAYQQFVTRAKISEGLTLLTPVKAAIIEYHTTHGDLPTASNWLVLLRELGLPNSSVTGAGSGRYVSRIWWNNGQRQIRVRYGVAPIADKLLYLQLDIADGTHGTWRCLAPPASADGIPAEYLPASCRG